MTGMSSPTPKNRTILYIEDDPASRRLVERTLKFAGFNVLVAECGLEGVDLAMQNQPDLILTDINLPDLSGQEIATRLRNEERFKNTPIVALTAQGRGTKDWELAFAAGVNGYLTKPIDVEELSNQIDHYLSGANDQFDENMLNEAKSKYTGELASRLEARIRELEAANRELKHLDSVKDTFIEITAHELRTPMTLVYGYSRLLEDYPAMKSLIAQDAQIGELLTGMGDAITRMQGIIGEIVTVGRVMTRRVDVSISPVNPGVQLEKALRPYTEPAAQRKITLHYNLEEWKGRLKADGDLLRLALENLISNAIKFTPDGGHVYFSIKFDDKGMTFSIRDTGIGIDKAQQQKIFDAFYTTTDVMLHSTSKTAFKGGGLGVGLAVAKGAVEAHGGQIWVESDRHDPETLPGSTFTVFLPADPKINRKEKQVISNNG